MLNEEKIRIMTDMARYEQGKGKEELRIQKYFRRDYIGKALLRNFFWTTLGYLLLVAVYFIYHMEYYMDNITKMPITPLLMRILLGYVLMLAIYSGLVYLLESLRYVRAKQGAEHYTEYINRLLKLYKREEKLGPGEEIYMTIMLEFKEKIKQFYAKYGNFILPVLKAVLALLVFLSINQRLGYLKQFQSPFVLGAMVLLCAVAPWSAIAWLGIFLTVMQCFGLGIEVGAFAGVLFLLLYILFLRFVPDDILALVLMPLAFSLHIPCAVPLGLGLLKKPSSAVSAGCGVVFYYFIDMVQNRISIMQKKDEQVMLQTVRTMTDGLVQNKDMLITVIAVVVTLLIVYAIRRLRMDYSWQTAVLTGGISYLILMIAGGLFLDVETNIPVLAIGTAVSCLLAIVLGFFAFHVDYSRSEFLQYEDDEYYYYVKAVPKVMITRSDRKVQTIQENSPSPRVSGRADKMERMVRYREEPTGLGAPKEEKQDFSDVDFERRLEESLKKL